MNLAYLLNNNGSQMTIQFTNKAVKDEFDKKSNLLLNKIKE